MTSWDILLIGRRMRILHSFVCALLFDDDGLCGPEWQLASLAVSDGAARNNGSAQKHNGSLICEAAQQNWNQTANRWGASGASATTGCGEP
jgi:hypothetical protein